MSASSGLGGGHWSAGSAAGRERRAAEEEPLPTLLPDAAEVVEVSVLADLHAHEPDPSRGGTPKEMDMAVGLDTSNDHMVETEPAGAHTTATGGGSKAGAILSGALVKVCRDVLQAFPLMPVATPLMLPRHPQARG
jgi:hypothetical protein